MTWGELKKRVEQLGIKDSDQVGISEITEDGFATMVVYGTIQSPHVIFPPKRRKRGNR